MARYTVGQIVDHYGGADSDRVVLIEIDSGVLDSISPLTLIDTNPSLKMKIGNFGWGYVKGQETNYKLRDRDGKLEILEWTGSI